jgi:phage terminase large subunit-like protein
MSGRPASVIWMICWPASADCHKFDAKEAAERNLALVGLLPHTKGEWGFKRQLITLEPWQKFSLACTFWMEAQEGWSSPLS